MRTITLLFNYEYHTYTKDIQLDEQIKYIIVHTRYSQHNEYSRLDPIVYDEKPSYDVLKNTHISFYKQDLEHTI